MKVCLGIPNGGTVKSRLMTDLIIALFSAKATIGFVIAETEGTLGPHNRWLAAQQAVKTGCDYLWLVDNDMVIPQNVLPKLLSAKKDLIGADYNYRMHPLQTVVKVLDANGTLTFADPARFPKEPFCEDSDGRAIAAIGSGCKLVKVSALKTIPQPWFALAWDETGNLTMTDDGWFCQQAAKVGIRTWVYPGLDVKHIGNFFY